MQIEIDTYRNDDLILSLEYRVHAELSAKTCSPIFRGRVITKVT